MHAKLLVMNFRLLSLVCAGSLIRRTSYMWNKREAIETTSVLFTISMW
jgi:hypothetical protein